VLSWGGCALERPATSVGLPFAVPFLDRAEPLILREPQGVLTMLRKFVGATAVLLLASSFALAETVQGLVTKIEDNKVTVLVGRKKGDPGKEMTYDLAKDAKIFRLKGKDDKEDAKAGDITKAIEASTAKTKGVIATLEVSDGKVTEIRFRSLRKKGVE